MLFLEGRMSAPADEYRPEVYECLDHYAGKPSPRYSAQLVAWLKDETGVVNPPEVTPAELEWQDFCFREELLETVRYVGTDVTMVTLKGRLALRLRDESTQAESKAMTSTPTGGNRKKNINARMLEKMQADLASGGECHGWTCKQWAAYLGCTPPSVVATSTWEELAVHRKELTARKALDRHGCGGRRRKNT